MEFVRIDKNYMKSYINNFVSIIENVPNEYWKDEHFLQDLSGKWEYSVGIKQDGKLVAFIIASIKEENSIHIHKFMVHENYRSLGLGKILLSHFIELISSQFKSITLKVYSDNTRGINFYILNGFLKIKEKSGVIDMRRDIV